MNTISDILKNILNKYTSSLDNQIYNKRESAHSPNYNYQTEISFNHDIGLFGDIIITGVDSYFYDDQKNSTSNPYNLVHLNTGFNLRKFTLSFWIKNLLDKRYAIRGYIFDLDYTGVKLYTAYGNPRTIGASIEYSF